MSDFLNLFSDLFLWVLQSALDWDSVIFALPVCFVILSMLILIFRKAVFLCS